MNFVVQLGTIERRRKLLNMGYIPKGEISEKEIEFIENEIIPSILKYYNEQFCIDAVNQTENGSEQSIPIWLCTNGYYVLTPIEDIISRFCDSPEMAAAMETLVKKGFMIDAAMYCLDDNQKYFDATKYLEMECFKSVSARLMDLVRKIETSKEEIANYSGIDSSAFYTDIGRAVFINAGNNEQDICGFIENIAHEMFHAIHFASMQNSRASYGAFEEYSKKGAVYNVLECLAQYFAICYIVDVYLQLPSCENMSKTDKQLTIDKMMKRFEDRAGIYNDMYSYNASQYLYEQDEAMHGNQSDAYIQIFSNSIEGDWEAAFEVIKEISDKHLDEIEDYADDVLFDEDLLDCENSDWC